MGLLSPMARLLNAALASFGPPRIFKQEGLLTQVAIQSSSLHSNLPNKQPIVLSGFNAA